MKTNEALPSEVLSQLRRIGSGIKTARVRRHMTQEELAERVGTSLQTIQKIEGGSPGTRIASYPKVVQEMLGHASITLTMDTYSHVLPGMQEESAARLDALLATP